MQGGRVTSSIAFNDPLKREGESPIPPSPEEYRKLATRVVELHPITLAQNARTSGGGNIAMVPQRAVTVGPVETWQSEKVSIWQAGTHDNPFGQRLTALMTPRACRQQRADVTVADHPNVQFNYFRDLGTCSVEIHKKTVLQPFSPALG